jgi:hypothetical protein
MARIDSVMVRLEEACSNEKLALATRSKPTCCSEGGRSHGQAEACRRSGAARVGEGPGPG